MQILRSLSILAVLMSSAAPALAGDRGSMEDQLACTPDVYRLCSQFIPDEDAITNCLREHLSTLSAGCHKVFSSPPDDGTKPNDSE